MLPYYLPRAYNAPLGDALVIVVVFQRKRFDFSCELSARQFTWNFKPFF